MTIVCIKENVNVSSAKLGSVYELVSIKGNTAKIRMTDNEVIVIPRPLFNDMFEIK
jgi:hypothetical protein